jgi:hypothetical protein
MHNALEILKFEFIHSNPDIMHTELSPDRQYNTTGFTEVRNFETVEVFVKANFDVVTSRNCDRNQCGLGNLL